MRCDQNKALTSPVAQAPRARNSGFSICSLDTAWPLVLGHPSCSRYRPRETEHSVTCISFEQSKLLAVSGRKVCMSRAEVPLTGIIRAPNSKDAQFVSEQNHLRPQHNYP